MLHSVSGQKTLGSAMGKNSIARWIWVVVALICAANYARLFFAAEITDESQYVAQVHALLIDGQLFVSDSFIQGTPALLVAPLYALYHAVLGNEGTVLFLRHLYYALALVTFSVTYKFLSKLYPREWALVCALFFVAYIPFSIPSWSYNTVAYFLLPLSLILLCRNSAAAAVGSGVIAGVACFSYPLLGLPYLLLSTLLFVGSRMKGVLPSSKQYFLTAFGLSGAAAVLTVLSVGTEEVRRVLDFTSSFGTLGGPQKLLATLHRLKLGFIQGFLFVPLLLGIFAYAFRKQVRWSGKNDIAIVLVACIGAIFSRVNTQWSLSWIVFITPFLLVMFLLGRTSRIDRSTEPFWLRAAIAVSLVASAVFAYSSSNILVNSVLALVLPLSLLLLEAGVRLAMHSDRARRAWTGLLVTVAIFFTAFNFLSVYRDDRIWNLTVRIPSGPFKNIWTTGDGVAGILALEKDLEDLEPNRRSIFASYLPSAYLMTDLAPVTRMLYLHESEWPEPLARMILQRTLEGGEWPDIVVTKKSDDIRMIHQFEDFFTSSGKYELATDRTWYRILTKKAESD